MHAKLKRVRPLAGKPIPLVLGLAGLGAFSWGLYHLLLIGSCGGEYPACPPGSWKYFVAVAAGLPVGIIATIAGGGALTFMGTFLAVGVTSLVAALSDEGSDQVGFLVPFGAIFLLVAVGPLLALPFVAAKRRKAQRLIEHGSEAVGTVLEVTDTNVTVNNNPRVRLRFRIEPQDGSAPFEASKTVTVSRVEIPRPGDRYPVWFDPQDRGTWAFGTAMTEAAPPGVRRLFETARRAAAPAVGPPASTTGPEDPFYKLGKLNELRLAGAISDDEFADAKDKLLAEITA